MKRIILIATILLMIVFSSNSYAEEAEENEDNSIIQLGFGASVFTNCARGDGGGRINLHVRAARHAPFELEMSYTVARGGLEFILLVDVIRSRYIDWHFFDLGLYFHMGTRPFNNLNLERSYDIVLGTGIDVNIPNVPGLVVYLNARFYIPDPNRIISHALHRGSEHAQDIGERVTPDVIDDIGGFIESEYSGAIDSFEGGFRDIFRDVGVSAVIMLGVVLYTN